MSFKNYCYYWVILVLAGTCVMENISSTNNSQSKVCESPICYQTANNLLQSMDHTLNPCNNFYAYACSKFIKMNPVPSNKIEYGKFTIVDEDIKTKIQEMLTSKRDESQIPLATKSAIIMYNSCLDANETSDVVLEFLVDKFGGGPLISGNLWNPNQYNLIGAIFDQMTHGNSPLFSINVEADEKNTSVNIIYVDQADMNIDIDYYLDPEGYEHVLNGYFYLITNATKVLTSNEGSEIEEMAWDIISLETAFANISATFIEKQNSTRRYNRMTIKELQDMTDPDKNIIDWTDFLQSLLKAGDITEDEPIIVNEPNYITRLFKILNESSTDLLANYLSWNFIMFTIDEAWGQLEQLYFDFQELIGGAKKRAPRWEKCIDNIDAAYSYAVGQVYVNNFTDDKSRTDALMILKLLQQSFIQRLYNNRFMDNETKDMAIDKVNSMLLLVGYPDWINNNTAQQEYYKNYPQMTDNHLMNVLAVLTAIIQNAFSKLRLPTDPTSFDVSPMDVNAFYTATCNSITVPIGILNPPFYQIGAPSATNFGAIGTVLGHEITHGFDNDGRKYDKMGNLQEWWPQNVIDTFESRSKCFVKQYARCCPLYDKEDDSYKCVNGDQTLGENIADNGGLEVAYQAWKDWIMANGEDPLLPGMENFTSDQIFYLSFANIWCESYTVGSLLAELSGDEHSPESCRVNGAVSNSENFAKAFNCTRNNAMNRGRKRCTIW